MSDGSACIFMVRRAIRQGKGQEIRKKVYETGRKLYNAKNNDERLDIAVDAAVSAGKGLVKKGVKATADAAIAGSATSTAVAIAGAAGMTAKTGTAIATLSGCAATNATLCAIGTPVVSALGAVGVTVGAPAVVGGSKKHGGADLGPVRARRTWELLGVDGRGVSDEAPEPGHSGLIRLTPKMLARLQGFPDTWEFSGKKTADCRMIGNAFPPPAAEAVGRRIRECLIDG